MVAVTAYATAVPSNPGGWATTGNATGANDGAYATVSPARNVKAYIDLQLDPAVLGANIPSNAYLLGNVNRSVWWGSSTNSQVNGYRQWVIDGTPIGTEETVTLTTGVTEEAAVAPLTIEHLRAASVVLRLAVVRTGTQARTFSLDAVRLTFDYATVEPAEIWNGTRWVKNEAEMWNGTSWRTDAEIWNGTRWVPLRVT